MGTLVALAGWPAADPPEGAWCARLGDDVPVALATSDGMGPRVSAATSADGRLHLALAGVLANRRELEGTVDRSGAAPSQRSDAALALRLYEGRGEQSVTALRGGFAIALWDGRRGRMVLVRDPLGVQPLYFAAARAHCAAATRLTALLRVAGLAGTPDVAMVDVMLALGAVPAPATAYPGIRQVCPGELLVWEPGRLRAQRHWQLRFPEARDARRTVANEAMRRVREQLDDAVRVRTAGVVSGILLSGGLGAASVLAVATALDRRPALAATVMADDEDGPRAVALARRAGVEHAAVGADVDWLAAADASLSAHGEPVGDMDEALLAPAVSVLAGRSRTILVGAAAEDVLGGGPAERAWAAGERYRALPGLAREGLDILVGTGWPRGLASVLRWARSAPIDVFAGLDVSLGADARLLLYGPDLRRMAEAVPTRNLVGTIAGQAVSQGASDARDLLYAIRLAVGVPRVTARLATAVGGGVDLVFPLADPRLAQMSAAVPARVRASVRRRAVLLQQAVAAELSGELQRQPHRALVPGGTAWRSGSLAALLEETLSADRVARLGLFDAAGIARVRAAHAAGDAALAPVLWRLALVSRWLERPECALGAGYSNAPAATSDVIVSSS